MNKSVVMFFSGLVCLAVGAADYYVDCERGDDAASGAKGAPRRTLSAAMKIPGLASGDVVHVAPGTYEKGLSGNAGSSSNRVEIVAGVGLVSDEGKDVTFIEGYIPNGSTVYTDGGPTAVRGVYMNEGAWIRGFTIRNCAASAPTAYVANGGGIYGGTAIDCVVSNCYAVRAGGVGGDTRLIRCKVSDCGFVTGTAANGASINNLAPGIYGGSAFDSYIASDVYGMMLLVNCRMGNVQGTSTTRTRVYNSYVGYDGGYLAMTNCINRYTLHKNSVSDGATRTGTAVSFDAYSRPSDKTSPAVDAGLTAWHEEFFPSAFSSGPAVDIIGADRVAGASIDIGPGEYDMRRFVDAVNGKDSNHGLTAACAKQSLVAAVDGLTSGWIVRAAPGVYAAESDGGFRVTIPSGVGLESAHGAAETVIEGFLSSENSNGLGSDAIRGVYLNANAYVKGFTIRNCRTTSANVYGAGVSGASSSAVIGCVITNNICSGRGGGVNAVTCIGCYFKGNSSSSGIGTQGNGGQYVNCVVSGGQLYVDNAMSLLNCTLVGWAQVKGNQAGRGIYNSIISDNKGNTDLYNSVVQTSVSLDANYRPAKTSDFVDSDDALTYYEAKFPSAWTAFKDTDFAGGARVYNGKLDIGAGEYDYRADFGKAIAPKAENHFAVDAATPSVKLSGTSAVTLSDGDVISGHWTADESGRKRLLVVVAGEGSALVKVDGVVVAPSGSSYSLKSAAGEHALEISFTGTGEATVSGFSELRGVVLIFR